MAELYLDTIQGKRQNHNQLVRRNLIREDVDLEKIGIFPLEMFDPAGFDKDLQYKIDTHTEEPINALNNHYKIVWDTKYKPLATVKEVLCNRVGTKRKEVEVAGCLLGDEAGTRLHTDREAQSMLNNIVIVFQREPTRVINYKAANGWLTLDASNIEDLVVAMTSHVEDCFNREKEICDLINSAENEEAAITVYRNNIALDWPDNGIVEETMPGM